MSILINLLPDIRQAKLRERRRRQLFSGVSIAVWAVSAGVVILMSVYEAGQKVIISTYSGHITSKEQQLRTVSGLTDALTAQEHLASLPTLYSGRVYMTKFFKAYTEADPTDITLTSLNVDAQNNLVVNGAGKSYAAVAKLARALAASNVTVGTGAHASNAPYFSNISITNLTNTAGTGITFTLDATVASEATSGSSSNN